MSESAHAYCIKFMVFSRRFLTQLQCCYCVDVEWHIVSCVHITVSLMVPDTCSLIRNTCCLAADRWESGAAKNSENQSVISAYQVMAAGFWLASCCPLQPCCHCCCCCLLAALLPSPSYTHRQTSTGCTASWASWRSCLTCPRSGWWTARATSCSCLPERCCGVRKVTRKKKS